MRFIVKVDLGFRRKATVIVVVYGLEQRLVDYFTAMSSTWYGG